MLYLRSSIFMAGYVLFTVFYGTLSVFVWLLPPLWRHKTISSWTTLIVNWARLSCGVRYRVLGEEHLPPKGKAVVVLSKHQSAWETLYLQSLFWPATTVLKKELLRIPFFGWGLRAMSPIGIDRSNPRNALRDVKTKGIKRLAQGLNVILFPEGTRMPLGERGTYARSGADIALKAEAVIVPIAHNAASCWPSKSFIKHPGLITVSIGPAIETTGRDSKSIMKDVEAWIEEEVTRLDRAA